MFFNIIRYTTVTNETPEGTQIKKMVHVKGVEYILKERGLYVDKNPETLARIVKQRKARLLHISIVA
jgi:hypothetical protein